MENLAVLKSGRELSGAFLIMFSEKYIGNTYLQKLFASCTTGVILTMIRTSACGRQPFIQHSKMWRFIAVAFAMLFVSNVKGHGKLSKSLTADSTQAPNVVFILADDLGWSDLGFYGNEIHDTPNIDRLAERSLSFTDAYAAAPICSPTRAAILTGKSPASLHFEFVTKPDNSKHPTDKPLAEPSFPRDLSLDEETFAEILNPEYKKGFFGKWHLTQENERYLGWGDTLGPLQQGFDAGSESRGSHPYAFSDREKNTFGSYKQDEYPEDELTNEAIAFMRENKNQPFLLYWSLYYVHTPVRTRSKWLYEKYEKRLGADNRRKVHYAAFVETMDHYVGQVLNEIKRLGIERNTVIIFTSDNGAHPGYSNNHPLKGNKWNLYEGGIRIPLLIRWPGKTNKGSVSNIPVTSVDFFPTICELTNTSYKPDDVEGVSLVPIINGKDERLNRSLYWHFPFYHPPKDYEGTTPSSAIRTDNYKLIYFYEDERTELYDLKDDIGEEHDLSSEHPAKTNQLKAQLFEYLKSVNARFPEERSQDLNIKDTY